jgi:hypothetical protein
MVKTDERVSLRKLYDLILADKGGNGYSLQTDGSLGELKVIASYNGSEESVTHTLEGGLVGKALMLANDGNDLGNITRDIIQFTVGDISTFLYLGDRFKERFSDFTEVEITNPDNSEYRLLILG